MVGSRRTWSGKRRSLRCSRGEPGSRGSGSDRPSVTVLSFYVFFCLDRHIRDQGSRVAEGYHHVAYLRTGASHSQHVTDGRFMRLLTDVQTIFSLVKCRLCSTSISHSLRVGEIRRTGCLKLAVNKRLHLLLMEVARQSTPTKIVRKPHMKTHVTQAC